jgi:hypothetical protein
MPGAVDPLYVLARAALLDALEALGAQRDAVILVGAQAIYMHTGAADLAVPEYTTDADVVIDPKLLHDVPEIESALTSAGFFRGPRVGAWAISKELNGQAVGVELDLMVPEAVGGSGRRAARLAGHNAQVARKARGLEAALIDKGPIAVKAFDEGDTRAFTIAIAGPAALLISKLHKIEERLAEGRPGRMDDKDALDVLRVLQAVRTSELAHAFHRLLRDEIAGNVTREALTVLANRFSTSRAPGSEMAARAAVPLADAETIRNSCGVLASDLLAALAKQQR